MFSEKFYFEIVSSYRVKYDLVKKFQKFVENLQSRIK